MADEPRVAEQIDHKLDDGKIRLLSRVLRQGTYEERFHVLHILAAHTNHPSSAMILLLALDDPEPLLRARALTLLGCQNARHFKPRIVQLLQDRNSDIRRIAVELLGKLHDPELVKPLLECLHDRNHWVRWATVEAVAWCEADFVAEALRPLIHDVEVVVRRRVCEVFNKLGPVPIIDLLERLADEDEWVRFWCVRALQNADDPWAISGIISCLKDPSDVVFTRAARSLGYRRAADAVPYLEDALMQNSLSEDRTKLILGVLKHIDTPEAQGVLQRWQQTQPDALLPEPALDANSEVLLDPAPSLEIEQKKHKRSLVSRMVNFFRSTPSPQPA